MEIQWKRIVNFLNSSRFPVVLDLVEDRVRSRMLTVLLFASILIFVCRVTIFSLFLNGTPLPQHGLSLQLLSDAIVQGSIGSTLSESVQVVVFDGIGARKEDIEVHMLLEAENCEYSKRGMVDTIFDHVHLGGEDISYGFVPKELQTPLSYGTSAKSDIDGFVQFNFFQVSNAIPGTYRIKLYADYTEKVTSSSDDSILMTFNEVEKRVFASEEILLTLESDVRSVCIVSTSTSTNDNDANWELCTGEVDSDEKAHVIDMDIGVPLSTSLASLSQKLTIEVRNSFGSSVALKLTSLIPLSRSAEELGKPQEIGGIHDPFIPVLANFSSHKGLTNTETADFALDFFTINGASVTEFQVVAVCEGVISPPFIIRIPSSKLPTSISIIAPPPGIIQEGRKFIDDESVKQPVSVRIDDLNEENRKNRVVFALIHGSSEDDDWNWSLERNKELTPDINSSYIGTSKNLMGISSTLSDEHGTVTFPDLGFTRNGPIGKYRIRFVYGGIFSALTDPVDVQTSVKKIEFELKTPNDENFLSLWLPPIVQAHKSSHFEQLSMSGIFGASVRILDSTDSDSANGLAGKSVTWKAVEVDKVSSSSSGGSSTSLGSSSLSSSSSSSSSQNSYNETYYSLDDFSFDSFPSINPLSNFEGSMSFDLPSAASSTTNTENYLRLLSTGTNSAITSAKTNKWSIRLAAVVDGIQSEYSSQIIEVINLMEDGVTSKNEDLSKIEFDSSSLQDNGVITLGKNYFPPSFTLKTSQNENYLESRISPLQFRMYPISFLGPLAFNDDLDFLPASFPNSVFEFGLGVFDSVDGSSQILGPVSPSVSTGVLTMGPLLLTGGLKASNLDLIVSAKRTIKYQACNDCVKQYVACSVIAGCIDDNTVCASNFCDLSICAPLMSLPDDSSPQCNKPLEEYCQSTFNACIGLQNDSFETSISSSPIELRISSSFSLEGELKMPSSCTYGTGFDVEIYAKDESGSGQIGESIKFLDSVDFYTASSLAIFGSSSDKLEDKLSPWGYYSYTGVGLEKLAESSCESGCNVKTMTDENGKATRQITLGENTYHQPKLYAFGNGIFSKVENPLNSIVCTSPTVKTIERVSASITDSCVETGGMKFGCSTDADCSNIGQCQCGVCVCPIGFDGTASCSQSFTDDSYSLKLGDLPVIETFQPVPQAILGSVSIKDELGNPISGKTVYVQIIGCDDVSTLGVFSRDVCDPVSPLDDFPKSLLASELSDNLGIAKFPSENGNLVYLNYAATSCARLRYVYLNVNSNGEVEQLVSEPSFPFRIINPINTVTLSGYSRVARHGAEFANQPDLHISLRPGFLPSQLPTSCNLSNCPTGEGLLVKVTSMFDGVLSDDSLEGSCIRIANASWTLFGSSHIVTTKYDDMRFTSDIMRKTPNDLFEVPSSTSVGLQILRTDVGGALHFNATESIYLGAPAHTIDVSPSTIMTVGLSEKFIIPITAKVTLEDNTPVKQTLVHVKLSQGPSVFTTLTNNQAVTNDEGVATFDDLMFKSGNAGNHNLLFTVGEASANYTVILTNPVNSIQVVNRMIDPNNDDDRHKMISTEEYKMPVTITLRSSEGSPLTIEGIQLQAIMIVEPLYWKTVCSGSTAIATCVEDGTVLSSMTMDFDPLETLETGSDGKIRFETIILSGYTHSVNALLLFTTNGVFSDPIAIDYTSFSDANEFSLASFTDNMWIPFLLLCPMFSTNTLYVKFEWRFLALMGGVASMGVMLYTSGSFLDQTIKNAEFFDKRGILYVATLDGVLVALVFLCCCYMIVLIIAHMLLERKFLRAKREAEADPRKRNLFLINHQGHYLNRIDSYDSYCKERTPGLVKSLITENGLSKLAVKAYSEIFQRYDTDVSVVSIKRGVFIVRKLGERIIRSIKVNFAANEKEVAANSVSQLASLAGLVTRPKMKTYCGKLLKTQMSFNVLKEKKKRYVNLEDFIKIFHYRLKRFGPFISRLDARRLNMGRTGWYDPMKEGCTGPKNGLDTMLADCFNRIKDPMTGQLEAKDLGRVLCPDIFRFMDECSANGMTLSHFLELHNLRIRSLVRIDGLVCDRGLWAEMSVFGYNRKLELRVMTHDGEVTDFAMSVLRKQLLKYVKHKRDRGKLMKNDALPMSLKYNEASKALTDGEVNTVDKRMFIQVQKLNNMRFDEQAVVGLFKHRYHDSEKKLRSFISRLCNNGTFETPSHETNAFYYPQRLMIGFWLSLLSCGCMALLVHYNFMNLKDWVNKTVAQNSQFEDQFDAMLNNFIEDTMRFTIDFAKQGLMGQVPSTVSQLQNYISSVAVLYNLPSTVATQLFPTNIVTDMIQSQMTSYFSGISNTTALVEAFTDSNPETMKELFALKDNIQITLADLQATVDGMNDHWEAVVIASGALAFLLVILTWAFMLSNYKERVFKARRGSYTLRWEKNKISRSVNYIGIQLAACAIGFFMLFFPIFILIEIFVIKTTRDAVVGFVINFLPTLLTISLFLTILQKIVFDFILTGKQFIRFRRLYMLAEMFFTCFNMFKGVIVGVTRLVMTVLFFGITFMRSDVSQLPTESENLDPVTAAFNGLLMIDMSHNHPIKSSFLRRLLEYSQNQTVLKSLLGSKWENAVSPAAQTKLEALKSRRLSEPQQSLRLPSNLKNGDGTINPIFPARSTTMQVGLGAGLGLKHRLGDSEKSSDTNINERGVLLFEDGAKGDIDDSDYDSIFDSIASKFEHEKEQNAERAKEIEEAILTGPKSPRQEFPQHLRELPSTDMREYTFQTWMKTVRKHKSDSVVTIVRHLPELVFHYSLYLPTKKRILRNKFQLLHMLTANPVLLSYRRRDVSDNILLEIDPDFQKDPETPLPNFGKGHRLRRASDGLIAMRQAWKTVHTKAKNTKIFHQTIKRSKAAFSLSKHAMRNRNPDACQVELPVNHMHRYRGTPIETDHADSKKAKEIKKKKKSSKFEEDIKYHPRISPK